MNQKYLNSLSNSINQYLKKADVAKILYQKKLEQINLLGQTQRFSKTQSKYVDITKEYQRWMAARQVLLDDSSNNITKTLQEGYLLIDKLRFAITGSETLYYVGIEAGRGASRGLYEGYLSLEQIMELTYGTAIWKNSQENIFKLRLKKRVNQLTSSLKKASTADYSDLQHIQRINRETLKLKNQGNLFETYRRLKIQNKHISSLSDTQIVNEIKDTIKNTTSFAKGGDYANESIKFFSGDPSFASLETIITTLKAFVKLLNQTDITRIKQGLEILFTKEGVQKFKEEQFQKTLDEELYELFSQLAEI